MKKKTGQYWILAFDDYYSNGGIDDYQFSFDTLEEFEEEILTVSVTFNNFQLLNRYDNYHFTSTLDDLTKWVCKNVGDEKYDKNM